MIKKATSLGIRNINVLNVNNEVKFTLFAGDWVVGEVVNEWIYFTDIHRASGQLVSLIGTFHAKWKVDTLVVMELTDVIPVPPPEPVPTPYPDHLIVAFPDGVVKRYDLSQ